MQDVRKILIAELTARPGCESDVQATLADYGKHVRKEPGNEAVSYTHLTLPTTPYV